MFLLPDVEVLRIEAGEKVDVFIYRMFVTAGDKAYLIENKALNENSMII